MTGRNSGRAVPTIIVLAALLALAVLVCKQQDVGEPPVTPAVPSGPSTGGLDSLYEFTSFTSDIDGDSVAIRFSWGDGDTSEWSGWVASRDTVRHSHAWSRPGSYWVGAQAKDAGDGLSSWSSAHAVDIAIAWSRTLGGDGEDCGLSVEQTTDGGYIMVGYTQSYGAGSQDVWLIKTDPGGRMVWSRTFGGAGRDRGYSVRQTADGGYVIAGSSESFGAGSQDVWLIRTDSSGNRVWDRAFGGVYDDEGHCVEQTLDGGYIVCGLTWSNRNNRADVWLIKTDANGNETWDRTFGGSDWDIGYSVQQTPDRGYIVGGHTFSNGTGLGDVWLIKTDGNGTQTWDRTFGTTDEWNCGYDVRQTTDGGYIVAGVNSGYEGDNHNFLLAKADADGNFIWNRLFGGWRYDEAYSVQQTTDGGYVVAGYTGAGGCDVWLIKTDGNGMETWERTFGGTGIDGAYSVQQTEDGGYVIVGYTESYGAGESDVWLIKVDANGN